MQWLTGFSPSQPSPRQAFPFSLSHQHGHGFFLFFKFFCFFFVLAVVVCAQVFYQLTFFLVAATFNFDKVTDFAGSTNFVLLALLTAILHGSWHLRQVVLTAFVVIWGLRLGIFLLMRILQWGEDKRFDDKRNNILRFAVFWVIQAIWVWTVSLPVTVVNASNRNPSIHTKDVMGWILWVVGFSAEVISDQQKSRFKTNLQTRAKWCDAGLWRWSRHPNYFGEILLWWGIFVSSIPVLHDGQWAVVVGPLFITLILLFLSGIPLLEASANKRFKSNPDYLRYKKETSPLIPLPPMLYRNLPQWFKKLFLFEFPLYSKNLSTD